MPVYKGLPEEGGCGESLENEPSENAEKKLQGGKQENQGQKGKELMVGGISTLPLSICVTLAKLLHFCMPECPVSPRTLIILPVLGCGKNF